MLTIERTPELVLAGCSRTEERYNHNYVTCKERSVKPRIMESGQTRFRINQTTEK